MKLLINFTLMWAICHISVSMYGQVYFAEQRSYETWQVALIRAKQENKLLFLRIYTDWSPASQRMDREVFADRQLGQYMEQNFINVQVNGEGTLGSQLIKTFGVEKLPSFIIFDSREQELKRLSGFQSRSGLLQQLRTTLYEYYDRAYGVRLAEVDKDKVQSLLQSARQGSIRDGDLQEALDYLQGKSLEELLRQPNWEIAMHFATPLQHPVTKRLLSHYAAIGVRKGVAQREHYVSNVYNHNLKQAIDQQQPDLLRRINHDLLPIYTSSEELPKMQFMTRRLYYGYTSDATAYAREVENYHRQYASGDPNFLYHSAYEVMQQHSDNPQLLQYAETWLQQCLREDEKHDIHTLLAYLYGLMEQRDKGEYHARRGIALSRDAEERKTAQEVLRLIQQIGE